MRRCSKSNTLIMDHELAIEKKDHKVFEYQTEADLLSRPGT